MIDIVVGAGTPASGNPSRPDREYHTDYWKREIEADIRKLFNENVTLRSRLQSLENKGYSA